MDYNPGTVTLPIEDYEEMKSYEQNQDPMTRQERIDSSLHTLVVVGGIGVVFVASTSAYYWLKDRFEAKSFERKLKADGQPPIESIPPQR